MQVVESACANRAGCLIRWTSLTHRQCIFEKYHFKSQTIKVLDKIDEEDEECTARSTMLVCANHASLRIRWTSLTPRPQKPC